MVKTPLLLSLILVGVGGIVTYLILTFKAALELSGADLVSLLLQLWLAVAGVISVLFVVSSYIQTNQAFAAAQRPHLLMQVHNTTQVATDQTPLEEGIHWTRITYQNITDNAFQDLAIKLSVTDGSKEAILDDLFKGPMFMAGQDSRTRSFTTLDHLRARGVDLPRALENDRELLLRVGYEFTFLRRLEKVRAQQYRWDRSGGWQLT